MKPQLKNWKTTIAGAVLAGLLVMQEHDLSDWKAWVLPVAIAVLGFLARDADKSTEESK
jgi:hypothetical protein